MFVRLVECVGVVEHAVVGFVDAVLKEASLTAGPESQVWSLIIQLHSPLPSAFSCLLLALPLSGTHPDMNRLLIAWWLARAFPHH